jgi:hypothetical protein
MHKLVARKKSSVSINDVRKDRECAVTLSLFIYILHICVHVVNVFMIYLIYVEIYSEQRCYLITGILLSQNIVTHKY